jgi:hypothetical protein
MENPSSSDIESAVTLTEQLGRDLLAAMTGKLPKNTSLAKADEGYAAPRFGSVYYGPLEWFDGGSPHYGMVRCGRSEPRRQPEVPFSPITSQPVKRKKINRTVFLPAGALPPARRDGKQVLVDSRVLLFITIPLSQSKMHGLMDKGRMWYVKMLGEVSLNEARAIIATNEPRP